MILSGDLGGTNCRLAVFDYNLNILEIKIYKCSEYESFEEVVSHFIKTCNHSVQIACFGLPGPITREVCKPTTLTWDKIDAVELGKITRVPVKLLNDVQANAYGLETLHDNELAKINTGKKIPEGNRAVIAPGTGLGEAALIEVNGIIHAMASEGGHADFGPLDDLQFELIRYIHKKFKRVSYYLLLNGPGLIRMYNFLKHIDYGKTDKFVEQEMKKGDISAIISNAAIENRCEICVKALDMFISILASETANVALKYLATNGVYIGGGIVPRILDKLRQPLFMKHFVNKDKMAHFLKDIPVYVILNEKTALQGAAWYAKREAR